MESHHYNNCAYNNNGARNIQCKFQQVCYSHFLNFLGDYKIINLSAEIDAV